MAVTTLDVYAAFLTARWDELEKVALEAIEDDGGADEGFSGQYEVMISPPSGIGIAAGGFGEAAARMIATFAVPSAIRDDLAAKRAVLEECLYIYDDDRLAVSVVRLLATPFRDHPDHPANQETK